MQFGLCCISIELKEQGYSFQTMTYKRFSSLPRDEALEILGGRILNNMQVTHAHINYCADNGYTYRISKQTIQNTGVRISVHPSEFNVLASMNQDAVDRTIRELNFYADFLDMLGLPSDYNCPMNMHINNRAGSNQEVVGENSKNVN